ncbi:DnaJ-domain-containing protein [Jaminaea rosea]|uniref:DnaJ-domain-containing protein n=1 Tax=Jaminaea rosea TaxID=1569628 RepID=A0A316UY69_9BASI|nr:DnaJ-domain-containing protein [Jaminaea rosea]PWN30256.1 DnaJ-domain-containing protein [Jaminaea rosea]
MAAVVDLPFELPAAPSSFKPSAPASISKLGQETILPAGPSYVAHTRRQLRQLDFAADDAQEQARLDELNKLNGADDELDNDIGDEPESADLLNRDPKQWKGQDHYAVLGLSGLRYKATPNQIKIAHRKKVLKHHPDKKAGASGLTNDDSFFKCVAKAHDVLSNPEKRRQFDSVDEGVDDDDVPTGKEKPEQFFKLWGPVFERESRFSVTEKNGPTPALGDLDSSRSHVDEFYDFWYNFDSWRSFEYLDKEVNEGSDDRADKRYQEKKNRNERAARKKEDNARLRNLVDKALSLDPRIKKFKQEDKAAREAKKNKGRPGAPAAGKTPQQLAQEKAAKEAEEKKAAEEAKKKEEADKAGRQDAKKAREAAKKALKKEKKKLADAITSNNYFQPAGSAPSAQVIEKALNSLDALVAKLGEEDPTLVVKLREDVEKAGDKKAVLNKAAEEKGVGAAAFD